jgi:hypothetical protein
MRPYAPRRASQPTGREVARPVFGIDIDGTLGRYHEHFIRFAEGWLGKSLPPAENYAGGSFAGYLGISKTTYRQVKLAYRRGGMKRSMPTYPMASELTRGLRKRGAVVIICTTRPYLQLDNVEPDTTEWLRRNRIQHDAVLSGENKYRDLKRQFGKDRIVAVIEDLPEMARQASACGLYVLLQDRPYNRPPLFDGSEWEGLRCEDLYDTAGEAHGMLDVWEEDWR